MIFFPSCAIAANCVIDENQKNGQYTICFSLSRNFIELYNHSWDSIMVALHILALQYAYVQSNLPVAYLI